MSNDINIPYYKAAMNSEYFFVYSRKEDEGYTDEMARNDARKYVEESSRRDIENKTSTRYSLVSAVEAISAKLHLTPEELEDFTKAALEGPADDPIFKEIGAKFPTDQADISKFVIYILRQIHNTWVRNNTKKFNAYTKDEDGDFVYRNKEYKHMPFELIGWYEVTKNYIFLEPILDSCDVTVNIDDVKIEYYNSVEAFFVENNCRTIKDFQEKIEKADRFYPSLEGQETINSYLRKSVYVSDLLIPQKEKKGLGRDSAMLEKIYENVARILDTKDKWGI